MLILLLSSAKLQAVSLVWWLLHSLLSRLFLPGDLRLIMVSSKPSDEAKLHLMNDFGSAPIRRKRLYRLSSPFWFNARLRENSLDSMGKRLAIPLEPCKWRLINCGGAVRPNFFFTPHYFYRCINLMAIATATVSYFATFLWAWPPDVAILCDERSEICHKLGT